MRTKNLVIIGIVFVFIIGLIFADLANLQISFVFPTPSNATITSNSSVQINVSISTNSLNSLTYNWNNTNYTIYNDSLMLMYNFDNRSDLGENATRVFDSSNRMKNGSVNGAVWNSSGKYGGCYTFNGVNNYINVSNTANTLYSFADNFTVAAWIKPSSFGFLNGIVSKYNVGGTNGFTLRLNGASPYNKIAFMGVSSTTPMTAGNWYYVVGVMQNGGVYVYINSVLETYSATPDVINSANTDDLLIGVDFFVSPRYFNGSIDEVRIWNRSLSASEIYEQYASNLQKFNSTQWYFYINQSKNSTTGLVDGVYNYQIFATNSSGGSSSTDLQQITIGTYPRFLNITDNNRTLTGSGIALFNSTVENTNGTVWLSINGTNYTATNLTSNVYNVSLQLSAGTYSYQWWAYGNSSGHYKSNSSVYSYTVLAASTAQSATQTQQTSSGGGSGSYLSQQKYADSLLMYVFMVPNKVIASKIVDDKETGIKEIKLRSKNWLTGQISIVSYNSAPDFCKINYPSEYDVYKVLDFNNTINENAIDSVVFEIGVSKDWIYSNNISEIKVVRCSPNYEEVKSSYLDETNSEGIYEVYSSGFSAYAILGTLMDSTQETNNPESNYQSRKFVISLFRILLILLVILLIFFIIKHHGQIRETLHTRFFDFEFKFKIKK